VKILRHKQCAFVRFDSIETAGAAFSAMNGGYVHGQQIKIGWGKSEGEFKGRDGESSLPPNATKTLWLGNIDENITEDELRREFAPYGNIQHVRVVPHKSCAFVSYDRIESTLEARRANQGRMIRGKALKINFGKEDRGDRPERGDRGDRGDRYGGGDRRDGGGSSSTSVKPSPPTDPEEKGIIEKMADYVARNGPKFEDLLKEKQKENPKFGFLYEGSKYYDYYKFRIYAVKNNLGEDDAIPAAVAPQPIQPTESQNNGYNQPPPAAQQWQQPQTAQFNQGGPEVEEKFNIYTPMDEDDVKQFSAKLDGLVGTKESIKDTKNWIMERLYKASDVATFMKAKTERVKEFVAKLNIIYVANDVLHHGLKLRTGTQKADGFSTAFQPHLATMLRSAYVNGFDPEGKLSDKDRLEKLSKLLRIWRDKAIYPGPVIDDMEDVVKGNKSASASSSAPSSSAPSQPASSSHSYSQQQYGQQGGYGQSYNNQPPPPEPSHYGGGGGGGFHAVPPPPSLNAGGRSGHAQQNIMSSVDDFLSREKSKSARGGSYSDSRSGDRKRKRSNSRSDSRSPSPSRKRRGDRR
jgi:RNA recognition motif-containing protein